MLGARNFLLKTISGAALPNSAVWLGGAQVQIDTIRLLVLLNMRVVTQPE